MLALELSDEEVDKAVVKVLTTQVGVTSGGLDLRRGGDGAVGGARQGMVSKAA